MPKKALITGVNGQDGAYLAKLLVDKGYKVYGGVRRASSALAHRLVELGVDDEVEKVHFELSDLPLLMRVIDALKVDEFYNLAAQSFVRTSWDEPLHTTDVDGVAVCRILEAIRTRSPQTRFYQASTSEMFGLAQAVPQSETTPFHPRSPYGVAKLYGHWITVNFRESFGLHASSGILFNHESPLRGSEFVTRKISLALARIAKGEQKTLELGNLSAKRDWGFAGDYVVGMWQMLQQDEPGDYVLGTGETNSVRYFVEHVGAALGIDIAWEGEGLSERGIDRKTGRPVVVVSTAFSRPADVEQLIADPRRAREKLGWQNTVTVEEVAAMMARADYDRVSSNTLRF